MKTTDFKYGFHSRTELRVSLVLALAVAITAFALWVSSEISKEKIEEMADIEAEKEVQYLSSITNAVFLSTEWSVCSFLTAWTDVQADSLTPDGKYYARFVLNDEQVNSLEIGELSTKIRAFLNYNYEFTSCVLIFEPEAMGRYPEGISCRINRDTIVCLPESGTEAYHHSEFYEIVTQQRGVTVLAGKIQMNGNWVMTNAVSLYDTSGHRLGEFWVDIPIGYVSGILNTYQSENDIFGGLINDRGVLISCSDTAVNGLALEKTDAYRDGKYSDAWCRKVRECFNKNEKSIIKDEVFGQTAYTFVIPVLNYPFKLLIVKPEGHMYKAAYKLRKVHWIILSGATLLIFLCLIYIYRIIKKKNREKHQMEAELNIAASIQQRILPFNPTAPLDIRLDVYGFQRPAKSVGGDLYDFTVKDDILYFCIGDVSGKGVPAAMVMSEVSSLYRNIIRQPMDVQEIMTRLNRALMEHGDDSMFCTLLIGILNLETGHLEYCNAGHNPPILIRQSKANYLKVKPNIMLYAFEDYAYQKESMELESGDRLILYTDGFIESKNTKNGFFGEKATLDAVQDFGDASFAELVKGVCEHIANFAQKAEQHDDMSMLCIGYRQAERQQKLHYDSVKQVVHVVDDVLEACGRPDDKRLRLALEEPIQNISEYAYAEDGPLDVKIVGDAFQQLLKITLIDSGKPFNPLVMPAPNLNVPVEEREIGGLGIYFTRQIMDDMSYIYENQQNKLILKYSANENQRSRKG